MDTCWTESGQLEPLQPVYSRLTVTVKMSFRPPVKAVALVPTYVVLLLGGWNPLLNMSMYIPLTFSAGAVDEDEVEVVEVVLEDEVTEVVVDGLDDGL